METIAFCTLIILFSLSIELPSVEAAQTISENPTDIVIKPGQEGLLACKVQDKVGACSWQMEAKVVNFIPGKHEWAGDESAGDCTLKILNAEGRTDEGHWSCHVSPSDPSAGDALETVPVYVSVGDDCKLGKPCSKTDDGNHTIPPKGNNPKTPTTHQPHHRPGNSREPYHSKGHVHPFASIFSYNYWKPRKSPLRIQPSTTNINNRMGGNLNRDFRKHDLFDGLRRRHYYHDHDFFTFTN